MVKDGLFDLTGIKLAIIKVLGFFVEATGTMDGTTRDEEGSADSLSVSNIVKFYVAIVHLTTNMINSVVDVIGSTLVKRIGTDVSTDS